MTQVEARAANDLYVRAREVALSPKMNDEFFRLAGETAAEAILREDIPALDMICGGLEMKFRNPFLQDEDKKLRLQGSMLTAGGSAAMIRSLRANNPFWPDRESNRASFGKAIDDLLAGRPNKPISTIIRVIPDAIQSFDKEYLQFVHDRLDQLAQPEIPKELRLPISGMLDVVRPALARIRGK